MRFIARHGNVWTVNECLRLEREYDLLKLSIDEIAERHKRTPNAIIYKLDAEGIANYNDVLYEYRSDPKSSANVQRSIKQRSIQQHSDDDSVPELEDVSDSTYQCESSSDDESDEDVGINEETVSLLHRIQKLKKKLVELESNFKDTKKKN